MPLCLENNKLQTAHTTMMTANVIEKSWKSGKNEIPFWRVRNNCYICRQIHSAYSVQGA